MPPASAQKLAYNKQIYEKNKEKKKLIDTIRFILEGRKIQAKTLEKYGWTLVQVNRIRALNLTFHLVIEDTHGVKLEKLYRGKTALPPAHHGDRPSPGGPRAGARPQIRHGTRGQFKKGDGYSDHLEADQHLLVRGG